jgi:hypothetical protein
MFDWWLQRSEDDPAVTGHCGDAGPDEARSSAAPGTSIRYDAGLLSQLAGDHKALSGVYDNIVALEKRGDYASLAIELNNFRALLREHVLRETTRLYIYLENTYSDAGGSTGLIREFRRDANQACKQFNRFVSEYCQGAWNPARKQRFRRDLEVLGKVLRERIEMEEDHLFFLYTDPDEF